MIRRVVFIYGLAHMMVMVGMTLWSALKQPILDAGYLFAEPWFLATIVDAYLGFLVFFIWVMVIQKSMASRLVWLVLICGLGNIAIGLFIMLRALMSPPSMTINSFLTGDAGA